MNLIYLTNQIERWAEERNLDTSDPTKQMLKLMEEVGELAQGLVKNKHAQVVDSIGDIYVVLTILSMQLDIDLEYCVNVAYKEIEDRKGKMVNGTFIKESDLE